MLKRTKVEGSGTRPTTSIVMGVSSGTPGWPGVEILTGWPEPCRLSLKERFQKSLSPMSGARPSSVSFSTVLVKESMVTRWISDSYTVVTAPRLPRPVVSSVNSSWASVAMVP
jgi:hypothetical protein